jgi:replicative DNA helicase
MTRYKFHEPGRRPSGHDPFSRVAPTFPDTERTVLAGILNDHKLFRLIQGITRMTHFHFGLYRDIYTAFEEISARKELICEETVSTWLINQGILHHPDGQEVRGIHPEISRLKGMISTTDFDIVGHARRLKRGANMRELIDCLKIALDECYETDNPAEVITNHLKAIAAIDVEETENLVHISGPVDYFWLEMMTPSDKKSQRVINTGFPELDGLMGGISQGTITVVAAREKGGKSTFCTQLVTVESRTTDNASIYFLLEMDNNLLIRRMVQQVTGLPIRDFISGKRTPSQADLTEIQQAVIQLRDYNIFLVDRQCDSVTKMRQYVYNFIAKHPNKRIGWIVADHWNLFEGNEDNANQARNAKEFNDLIKEINARGLLPAQCRKPTDANKEKNRPTVSDVRGSNALVEIASNLLVLHRPNRGTGQLGIKEHCELYYEFGREAEAGAKLQMLFDPRRIVFEENVLAIIQGARNAQ